MFSLAFPVGILFPTGHKVSCLIKLIGDFMNNLENKIKELEKENLDLKIRIRIVESQEKETQKKISYRHYKMLIIGYVFSTILASHIGELGTLIACTIALLILHLKEVKNDLWYSRNDWVLNCTIFSC